MSEINGDKARFNKQRKMKIAKRQRTSELLKLAKSPNPVSGSKQRTVKI